MIEGLGDKDFYVVGIGTRMSRDDEIGLRLVEDLALDPNFKEQCVLFEGIDAASVASMLIEYLKPLLFVDCADMGLCSGESRLFDDTEADIKIQQDSVSTHGMGLAQGIALARGLGFGEPIRIFAVQPFDLSPSIGLTEEMERLRPALLDRLRTGAMEMRQVLRTRRSARGGP